MILHLRISSLGIEVTSLRRPPTLDVDFLEQSVVRHTTVEFFIMFVIEAL